MNPHISARLTVDALTIWKLGQHRDVPPDLFLWTFCVVGDRWTVLALAGDCRPSAAFSFGSLAANRWKLTVDLTVVGQLGTGSDSRREHTPSVVPTSRAGGVREPSACPLVGFERTVFIARVVEVWHLLVHLYIGAKPRNATVRRASASCGFHH